jgi:hypothetical protein
MPYMKITLDRLFIDSGIVLSMFMLSCIFVIVCGLFVWKRVYVGLFIYVLSLEIQLSKRNGHDPITGLAILLHFLLYSDYQTYWPNEEPRQPEISSTIKN